MQATDPVTQRPETTSAAVNPLDVLKVLVLFGLAVYFAYNIVSGNITNYINIRFDWLSYVAVFIFAMLGIGSAWALYRRDTDAGYSADAHEVSSLGWWTIIIVALPLVMGTLIPSRPLSVDAISGGVQLSVASANSAAAFSRDPLERNVLDWLRVFAGETTPSRFDGEQANIIGFVYREPDFPTGHFMVARFTVSCCVADAQPIGLPVYAPELLDDLVDGDWVEVNGAFEAAVFRDTKVPIIQADAITIVSQPEHPYLYP